MNFDAISSRLSRAMKPSVIRALLKLVQDERIISLAGGTPDASLFPLELFAELARKAILDEGRYSLQYGLTQGWLPLREQLSAYLGTKGIQASPDEILITNGSQQGIDLLNRVLLDAGDLVAVEDPSYLGALIAFNTFSAKLLPLAMDAQGLIPEALEEAIASGRKPKLLYLTPSFQNPSGRLLGDERRKKIAAITAKHGIVVAEDDPYGEINFGSPYKPLKAYDADASGGNILHLGSFSKIGSPGMRLGWAAGPKALIDKMVLAKESADVCTNVLSQAIAAGFLKGGHLAPHLRTLISTYQGRAKAMSAALKAQGGLSFEEPQGGFFVWAQIPAGLDSTQLLTKAVEAGVAFVPGDVFFAREGGGKDRIRLTFCTSDEARITEGVARLSGVIKSALAGAPA
jgi:2-aminoadipate transaminase